MKIAIVTGASSGMGREFVVQVQHLYSSLDEVWVVARRQDRLEALVEDSKVTMRIFCGDLQKKPVYAQIAKVLKEENPDIRMLVNAAGFGKNGTVEEILEREEDAQEQMIDLNCKGLTKMTLLCLPYMKKGARIVNLASAAAFCPQPHFAVYAATKAYVLSFSRGLGAELKEKGIYVTAVCPGPVETEFFKVSGHVGGKLKKAVMVKPGPVVKRALQDARAGRPLSIYGTTMKGTALATKVIPHDVFLKLETTDLFRM
ncbi:SDR family NAD(P)-dependent oxidoreductase [Hespellia stercorisuis]|uniref:Short-chain dehydrogenase n=1 Tax=Hespellia stercorisuis DSM 15480 TaxID=1121950 RepID=A0A1M6S321_9FIRM|nr:SDR family NAD(P)-dependent oxidoreductase [Hespellia stercorisuis]SHK39070.1 hypothetical protein SAMN02745243_02834 [Hespellia stercorisuis DSM 15480]